MANSKGALYTGMTNNIRKRTWQHKNKVADSFTRQHNITKLVSPACFRRSEGFFHFGKLRVRMTRCSVMFAPTLWQVTLSAAKGPFSPTPPAFFLCSIWIP
jgi:hypothetical protein